MAYGVFSSIFFGGLLTLIFASCFFYFRPNPKIEHRIFWISASFLILFCALRPMGIARDDLAYIEIARAKCTFFDCLELVQSPRDWIWHSLVGLIKSFVDNERAPLILSAIGAGIQILVIDRLCRHKLLALTLFIPLTFLIFDFTLLRAGLTLSIYFISLYLLAKSWRIFGSVALASNYLFHAQGIFSIGVLPFAWLAKYRVLLAALLVGLIACIYLQWTPSAEQTSYLARGDAANYWLQYKAGVFNQERIFPLADIAILIYLGFILAFKTDFSKHLPIERYALGSILLAVFLAWFFAPIHAVQTRLFDFYVAPLIFLAGNLRLNLYTLVATLGLAILLYTRTELIHNWIMG
jgi:hypothetical protein